MKAFPIRHMLAACIFFPAGWQKIGPLLLVLLPSSCVTFCCLRWNTVMEKFLFKSLNAARPDLNPVLTRGSQDYLESCPALLKSKKTFVGVQ